MRCPRELGKQIVRNYKEDSAIRLFNFQLKEWKEGRREAPPCPETKAAYEKALDAKAMRGEIS